jgi:hypothetical protein
MLINVLGSHNLTCNLSLPSRGEVWRNVNEQLSTHLRTFHIDFIASPPASDGNIATHPYFQSPMIHIAPRKPRQTDSRKFTQTDLVAGDFKVPTLVLHANKATNPCVGDERPLLFFGACRL